MTDFFALRTNMCFAVKIDDTFEEFLIEVIVDSYEVIRNNTE